MKLTIAVLLGSLCVMTSAMATSPVLPASDRVEVAPGMFAISHTENFEYVCAVETTEGGTTVKFNTFLDIDFPEGSGYRFAVGFVGGGSVAGMFAAEVPVVSVSKGRCPGLCKTLTVKSNQDGSTNDIHFDENGVTKVISINIPEANSSTVGTCTKNEVP